MILKNFIFSGILFLLFPIVSLSQTQIPKDTIIYNIDEYRIFYDNAIYKWHCKNKCDLYKDSILLEKNISRFSFNKFSYEPTSKKMYFIRTDHEKIYTYCFDIIRNEYKKLKTSGEVAEYLQLEDLKLYYTKSYDQMFIEYTDKEKIDSFDINKKLDVKGLSILEIIKFNNSNRFLINAGVKEAGAIYNSKYYIVNEKSLSLKKIGSQNNNKEILNEKGIFVNYYFNNYAFLNKGIIDSNFQLFSKKLKMYIHDEIKGLFIKNNEIIKLIVQSETDEKDRFGNPGKSVLIQYTPSPHRERIMYRLYHNKIITREELERFDAFELRLFRNMIFAKYNYDFNDKYLTAYFNLYSFYKWKKDTRTKDMSGKLTEADKKNLELIKKIENEM